MLFASCQIKTQQSTLNLSKFDFDTVLHVLPRQHFRVASCLMKT